MLQLRSAKNEIAYFAFTAYWKTAEKKKNGENLGVSKRMESAGSWGLDGGVKDINQEPQLIAVHESASVLL